MVSCHEQKMVPVLFLLVFLSLFSSSPPTPDGGRQMDTTLGVAHTWIISYFCLFYAVRLEASVLISLNLGC